MPIHERFLPELLSRHRGGRLRFSTSVKEAVSNSEAVFIIVGTPNQKLGRPIYPLWRQLLARLHVRFRVRMVQPLKSSARYSEGFVETILAVVAGSSQLSASFGCLHFGRCHDSK